MLLQLVRSFTSPATLWPLPNHEGDHCHEDTSKRDASTQLKLQMAQRSSLRRFCRLFNSSGGYERLFLLRWSLCLLYFPMRLALKTAVALIAQKLKPSWDSMTAKHLWTLLRWRCWAFQGRWGKVKWAGPHHMVAIWTSEFSEMT